MGLLTKRQQTGKELDKGLFTNFMITFVPSLIIWKKYMYLKHD